MCEQSINGLSKFLKNSPTAFHAVDTMSKMLKNEGYTYLSETDAWEIVPGGKYYTTRNQSSLIAFSVSENFEDYSFRITASHSDSPTFKIKENAELLVQKHYAKLNTEGYGGMLCSTWFDRPLSIAGRIIVKVKETDEHLTTKKNKENIGAAAPNSSSKNGDARIPPAHRDKFATFEEYDAWRNQ